MKVSADTSEAKKSILDLAKSLKDMKGSKVSLFTADDRKMIKTELKREMGLMKTKLKENRTEIKKMVDEQKNLTKGSKEELELRKKILESYKTQSKLGKELGTLQKTSKSSMPGMGGLSNLLGMAGGILGGGALALGGYALYKGFQATDQYGGGVKNRNRLKGLGVQEDTFGSPEQLARVGLTEQEMVQRRIEATSLLGRKGTSNQTELQKAGFERAYGLEGGTMTGIAGSLRGSLGGQGANQTQLKMQASVFASGIEDELGPYLKSMTDLLTSINENGTNSLDELIPIMGQLAKAGNQTPEQLSKMFSSIDQSVRGAKGESSAFLQTAFSRKGIGGGTIGGTKFSMESGGILGLSEDQLLKKGWNPELIKNMKKSGMLKGLTERAGAITDLMGQSGGLKGGESFSSVKDPMKMVGMTNMANSVFGTKGEQGFQALQMLEKVKNGKMSETEFNKNLKQLQEGNDPSLKRLDDINKTLSGQTDVLNSINTNLMETLGKKGAVIKNEATRMDNEVTRGTTNVAGAITDTGLVTEAGQAAASGVNYLTSGEAGGDLYDKMFPTKDTFDYSGEINKSLGKPKPTEEERFGKNVRNFPTAKDIGKEVANALKASPMKPKVNVKTIMQDGKMSDKTVK